MRPIALRVVPRMAILMDELISRMTQSKWYGVRPSVQQFRYLRGVVIPWYRSTVSVAVRCDVA